ncbi:MAG: O-antigen ligase family protein [Candidatus Dormibacterales bacterium]
MRQSLSRLGAYIPAGIALALPTVFVPPAVDSFILPRASIVVGGACLAAGVALLAPSGPGLGRLRWPLLAAAGAALLALVFSTAPALSLSGSYSRYESLPVRLGYLGLFAAPVWLTRNRRSRDLVGPALILGTAIACLEAIYQYASHAPFRPDGNLGNANLLGALIAMSAPLSVARALRGGRASPVWWAALVMSLGGLFVSTSRSGGIGVLVGFVVLAILTPRGRAVMFAAAGGGGLIAASLVLIELSPLRLLNDDPASLRLHLWQNGLNMIAARPLTGWGEDVTGLAFGRFLTADWSPGVTFDRLHSGPLDIAATQGLIGLAALAWLLVVFTRGGWRHRFAPGVAPMVAACAGYTAWVAFNFDWAPATGAFWLLAGTGWANVRAADAPAPEPGDVSVPPLWWRSALSVGLGAAAVALGLLPVLADVWYSQGRADLAVQADPLQARYHWSYGEALATQGSPARGVDELRRAADLGETDPGLYVELGDREKDLGRIGPSQAAYRRALEIDPFYAPALQRLAAT